MAETNARLGSNTKYVSRISAKDSRQKRWHLQNVAGSMLIDWRVSWCGQRMTGSQVKVMHNSETNQAFYSGVQTCGSVWVCPVCASRISETRRQELQDAVSRKGFTKILVTFTLQHERNDSLAQLVEDLNDSTRRLKQGRFWQDFTREVRIVAYVTASEYTYGNQAGWHPHKHMLIFLDKPENEIDIECIQAHLTARYQALLASHGRYASDCYGVDVTIGDEGAAGYVSKWGMVEEVTKAVTKTGKKGGLSPFQLLEMAGEGDQHAAALFIEYAKVTKGKRQLSWCHGGRQVLGLGEEKTDEEIAQEEPKEPATLLVTLNKRQWYRINQLEARLDILEVADSGNPLQVIEYLESIGVLELDTS